MTESDLRGFFNNIKPMIKINYFLKLCNISHSDFSHFMNDNYKTMSKEKLIKLYDCVIEELNSKIA